MSNVVFIGWNAPKVGRERQAGELFGTVVNFWQRHQEQGNIQSFQPVLLRQHGGDLNGFFLVTGDNVKLHEIITSEEWIKTQMQVGYCLDGFGVLDGYTGQELMDLMGQWQQMVSAN